MHVIQQIITLGR